jgi:asparagine synthase (glutamine-hydrolysing)
MFKQTPWNHYGIISLEQTQLSLRTPFLDNELVRTVFQAPKDNLAGNNDSLRLIRDGNPSLLRIPTDRGLAGEGGSLTRALSKATLEFLFKAEYAYDMGMPQNVARVDHAFSRLRLERLFLGRHKVFHFRVWYRDALSRYIRETLLDSTALGRSYINQNRVREIVESHTKGNRNYTNEIHQILTLELLHRLFLDHSQENRSALPNIKLPVANPVQWT